MLKISARNLSCTQKIKNNSYYVGKEIKQNYYKIVSDLLFGYLSFSFSDDD